MDSEIRLCKCGCGRKIVTQSHHRYYGTPLFIKGHNPKWITGRKGAYKHTKEWKEKARERMMGEKNPFYGKTHTEETKKKIKLFKKGHIPYIQGKHHTEETKQKNRLKHLGIKQSKETVRKRLKRKTPSSLEKKMISIISKYSLPYRFVGDGAFFIERKNPDFINCNGQKIAIEVFCRKHKELFRNGLENWKQERIAIFQKYGWKILFFDETQVNDSVKELLK
jgi:very-short-patch-repair endonuclease